MAKTTENVVYCSRWKPDFRYRSDKRVDVSLNNFKSTTPTDTDLEAYRITLASMRSPDVGSASNSVGTYTFQDGKYDPTKDFSYLNRKDLTIVDIDNYIMNFKKNLENYDKDLQLKVQEEIEKAERKKDEIAKSDKSNSTSSSDNSSAE